MRLIKWLIEFFTELAHGMYHDPIETKPQDLAMNQPVERVPVGFPASKYAKYDWSAPNYSRHSVRLICDEEGLTLEEKNTLCATVGGESEWQPTAVGPPNHDGTRDYGIAQINTHYWIGPGKQFPTTDYVLTHPEECIRWMCKQWKMGYRDWWVAYKNGSYKNYL